MKGLNLEKERLEQNGTEWQFSAAAPASIAIIPTQQRSNYLPAGELQFGLEDFMDCATRSPHNDLEAQFTYACDRKLFLPENIAWLIEKGYLDPSGRITFSDRYTAILSGTTRQGNSLKAPLESIRKNGLIPKSMLPASKSMNFDQYHDPKAITKEMRDTGQEFARRFTINYDQVSHSSFKDALKSSMVGVAGYAWPQKKNNLYPRTEEPPNHAFLLYDLPAYQAFDNYAEDNNQTDFTKSLAPDYAFYEYGYRLYILKDNPITQEITLWMRLLALLTQIRDVLVSQPPPASPAPLPAPKPVPPAQLLNAMCLAIQKHEGWFPGSRSYRNKNPFNLKYVGQPKAIGQDDKNFCIFASYEDGFQAGKDMILNAARGKSKVYSPSDNLFDFFKKYAPSSDNNDPIRYANVVAQAMNVNPALFRLSQLL